VGVVIAAQLRLGKAGVQLDLVNRRHDPGLRYEPRELGIREIRDADLPGQAAAANDLQGSPGFHVQVAHGQRPVDEIEINGIQAEPAPARVEGLQRGSEPLVGAVQLGRDDQLIAGDPRFPYRPADPRFGAISRRGVQEPVPSVDGQPDRALSLIRRDAGRSEAEPGNGEAVTAHHHRDLGIVHAGRSRDGRTARSAAVMVPHW
jgi:hypothetical protein